MDTCVEKCISEIIPTTALSKRPKVNKPQSSNRRLLCARCGPAQMINIQSHIVYKQIAICKLKATTVTFALTRIKLTRPANESLGAGLDGAKQLCASLVCPNDCNLSFSPSSGRAIAIAAYELYCCIRARMVLDVSLDYISLLSYDKVLKAVGSHVCSKSFLSI